MIKSMVGLCMDVRGVSIPPEFALFRAIWLQDIQSCAPVNDVVITEIALMAWVHVVLTFKPLLELVLGKGRYRRLPPKLVGSVQTDRIDPKLLQQTPTTMRTKRTFPKHTRK
jgi:hypothetical protein